MTPPLISPDNPLVKELVALHESRGRRAAQRVLVEGRRAIDGCLQAGWAPEHLLIEDGRPVPEGWPPSRAMGPRVAARLSQASTPSGYLASFPLPDPGPLDVALGGLVLAEVADPGNVGTLIRSAAALGLRQVVVCGGADPWSAKVMQSTAGAMPLVRVHVLPVETGLAPLAGGAPRTALVVRGGRAPAELSAGPRWVVVGGEARGIPTSWIGDCDEQLTLPMPGGTESLNAAVAGSMAIYLLVMR